MSGIWGAWNQGEDCSGKCSDYWARCDCSGLVIKCPKLLKI